MIEHTKNIIDTLYPMNACLLGEGYDNRLEFLKSLIKLDVLEFPSGTRLGTWTVPDEWVVRDAWLKDPKGKKIADYKKNPLSLVVGSLPFSGKVELDELRKHWHYSDDMPGATPYVFKYYDKDWGFCFPKDVIRKPNPNGEGGVDEKGEFKPVTTDKLKKGKYEVMIDTEYRPGVMKLGVHTIKGKTDREILMFAHLDHPFQANDNLSAVACLTGLVDRLTKEKHDHTIKIVFCPETIGSTAYALTQDLSKVDFVLAVDICGNDGPILFQKSWKDDRINAVTHLALQNNGKTYKKGNFRNSIGSDESVFNDPLIGIPGIMLSTWDYPEYHTDADTPDKINYEKIAEMQDVILNIVKYYEMDFIPERKFKGMLMRSRYGIQTPNPQMNLSWDYLVFQMDGKLHLSELCANYGINFQYGYDTMLKLEKDEAICRVNSSEGEV